MSEEELRPSAQLRVQRAVTDAAVLCGLAFTVVFCLGADDLNEQAEREFERLGLTERPHVMLLVEPLAGQFVLRLSGHGRSRLSDAACDAAAEAMSECYAKTSDVAECVEIGLQLLCRDAGPPVDHQAVPTLPSVVLVSAE